MTCRDQEVKRIYPGRVHSTADSIHFDVGEMLPSLVVSQNVTMICNETDSSAYVYIHTHHCDSLFICVYLLLSEHIRQV